VWYDRRGHHLVQFPAAAHDDRWGEALARLVKDGRVRGLEVRRIDGAVLAEATADRATLDGVVEVLKRAGFLDGYRGLVLKG
jgi:hypothetical protein